MTELFYKFSPDHYIRSYQILNSALKSEMCKIIKQLGGVIECGNLPVERRIRSTHIPGNPTIVALCTENTPLSPGLKCKYDRTDTNWCEVLDEDLPEIYLRIFEFLHKNYELKSYGN